MSLAEHMIKKLWEYNKVLFSVNDKKNGSHNLELYKETRKSRRRRSPFWHIER